MASVVWIGCGKVGRRSMRESAEPPPPVEEPDRLLATLTPACSRSWLIVSTCLSVRRPPPRSPAARGRHYGRTACARRRARREVSARTTGRRSTPTSLHARSPAGSAPCGRSLPPGAGRPSPPCSPAPTRRRARDRTKRRSPGCSPRRRPTAPAGLRSSGTGGRNITTVEGSPSCCRRRRQRRS
jgi:hypothetical protein